MKTSAKINRKTRSLRKTKQSSTQPRSTESEHKRRPDKRWLLGIGLCALGLAIYAPALSGPFFLDDYDLLEAFSTVRSGGWRSIVGTGRPLLMLTFIANHRLSGFGEPFGFHLTNVLLHCLNAVLLWRFLATLFAPGRFDDILPPAARSVLIYGVPLLFLTSPIQTESVSYVSSRSEVLAGTFYLATLWVFASPLREKHLWRTAFLTVFLFVCSFLSKQDKMTLPFVILGEKATFGWIRNLTVPNSGLIGAER